MSDVRAVSLGATSAALSRSASGCFPPDGIARFYLAQLFVQARTRNEDFFRANEGMAMSFVEGEPAGIEGGDDGCFFGMPHWQFNDWAVADGTMQ